MKKSTSFLIIAIIIFFVNMVLLGIPLIMFVALGTVILSVHYSIKEKKDRIQKN